MPWYGWIIIAVCGLGLWAAVSWRLWQQVRELWKAITNFTATFDRLQPQPQDLLMKTATSLDETALHKQLAAHHERREQRSIRARNRKYRTWGKWLQDGDITLD